MAKKDVPAIMSGMGVGLAILTSLMEKARKRGLPDEAVHRLATPDGEMVLDKVVEMLAGVSGNITRLLVNYTRPLSDLIRDCGFDWMNDNITEGNFPITKRPNGEVEMKTFHFNRVISSDEAIKEMEKEGYRPAELPEGLAYAKANPNEQRKYPIVILGSVWRYFDGRRVPCLCGDGGGRGLSLVWFEGDWDVDCRFLAVRK